MNHWYLVASLPMLADGAPPALSPAAFRALCGEHLPSADLGELDAVLQGGGSSAFAAQWRRLDAAITAECAVLRAARHGVDPTPWRDAGAVPDLGLQAQVRDALQQPDPRAREQRLDALRSQLLEQLAQPWPFGLPAVLAYGLRLQLAARAAARTEAAGRQRLAGHLDALLAEFDALAAETPA